VDGLTLSEFHYSLHKAENGESAGFKYVINKLRKCILSSMIRLPIGEPFPYHLYRKSNFVSDWILAVVARRTQDINDV